MSQRNHFTYRPDIDGMRALAIIAVIAFHAFPTIAKGGYVGVDVFFVISGFLISSILFRASSTGNFSFIDFYLHRAKRLFPALSVVLLATLCLGWIYLLPRDFAILGKHAAASAAFTQNLLLWSEAGYFDVSADQKPLLHLWSLGIEEQFYLIYPVIIWVLWRRPNAVLPALIALATISFIFNVATVSKYPAAAFFLPLTRFWELLSGAILAHTVMYRPNDVKRPPNWRNACSIVGILLIIVAVGLVNQSSTFPGWWALMPVAGAYLIIWAGTYSHRQQGNSVQQTNGAYRKN